MRSRLILYVALVATVALAPGCGRDPSSAEQPADHAAPPAAEPGHAAAGVVPGSYEDWCLEHAVPETQCTRCNPTLVAAFQATGDWCAEHGLPESQCLACNPDLKIVRPPKPSVSATTQGP
jgi:hypothetical protein